MANVSDPTEKQRADWVAWVEARPPKVRGAIEAHAIEPWKLYRMRSTGHRVTLYSIDEPEDESAPCTVTVNVTGEFNVVAFERRAFGVALDDLEECELPAPGELTGSMDMTIDEAREAMRDLEAAKPSIRGTTKQ